jgi:hypothetical protein
MNDELRPGDPDYEQPEPYTCQCGGTQCDDCGFWRECLCGFRQCICHIYGCAKHQQELVEQGLLPRKCKCDNNERTDDGR